MKYDAVTSMEDIFQNILVMRALFSELVDAYLYPLRTKRKLIYE